MVEVAYPLKDIQYPYHHPHIRSLAGENIFLEIRSPKDFRVYEVRNSLEFAENAPWHGYPPLSLIRLFPTLVSNADNPKKVDISGSTNLDVREEEFDVVGNVVNVDGSEASLKVNSWNFYVYTKY